MGQVYLITGNSDKLRSARKAFDNTSIQLKQFETERPEIQASSSVEIARHAVEHALEDCEKPVIREDHSLYLDAVPGFPGPYLSYFDRSLSAEKLLDIVEGLERTGYFEIGTVLGLPNGEIKEYEFKVTIELADEIRGDKRNWDKVMMLEGSGKTFAESDTGSRLNVWNRNYRKIAELLEDL